MKPAPACSNLNIEVAESYEAMSRQAERLIVAELKSKPPLILCASAGSTPTRTYELLAREYSLQPRLFERMRVIQIDEWGGLPSGSPTTCEADLRAKLLEPLHISKDRFVGFRSDEPEPEAECQRVAHWLGVEGPIDICILGLGQNGHIAMNEPAAAFVAHSHVARLARSSLNHPMLRNFARKPRFGLTIGIGDILRSRKILLLVNGLHKRAALQRLCKPEITTRFPASFLWLHPQVTVLCDRMAADIAEDQSKTKIVRGDYEKKTSRQ
jgi:galactosamine-6-phosphate isomerase